MHQNRLSLEKSPYLLQHAENPVDWYPWGPEAFQAAKASDRPIFLSIGYATCHWCHVMERESFENASIAQMMNDTFVNIKVDREEMPEIDALYMDFAQAIMPGGGGWPLNVILTPDLKPFFASTYVPPENRLGTIGMNELIARIGELWEDLEEREKLLLQADRILELFKQTAPPGGGKLPGPVDVVDAAELLFRLADPIYGGMRGAPKFPMGMHICFLLRYAKSSGDGRALFYADVTLDMMHRGGIYDHLGGGFSRYSVDDRWEIPHFEKMLYDNAQLLRTYTEAYLLTQKPLYRDIAVETGFYLLREMAGNGGGFYSAQDADTDGHEGLFYTWTKEEIAAALGQGAELVCDFYNVREPGNFEGRSVLYLLDNVDEFAKKRQLDSSQVKLALDDLRQRLLFERERRRRPLTDDKVLASWNGLAAHAMALAGHHLNMPEFTAAAKSSLNFLRSHLWQEGRLLHRWREGESKYRAGLDDYAFVIQACLTLFETKGELAYLQWAQEMAKLLQASFKQEGGAYYLTDGHDTSILLRRSEIFDSAEPSGNGIHCDNLLRLYQLTLDEDYLQMASDILQVAKGSIEKHPVGCCTHLMALQRYLDRHASVFVVALNGAGEWRAEIEALAKRGFHPHRAVIFFQPGDQALTDALPMMCEEKQPIDGKTTVYPCLRGSCRQPLNDWDEIQKMFESA